MKFGLLKQACCIIAGLTALSVQAQDHIYSQFFNAPVYLNPALNGQFKGDIRASLIYRNQWSSIPGDLNYFSASVDYQIPAIKAGVGLIFNSSNEGNAYLRKNNMAAVYSYSVGSDGFIVSFGLETGITNRSIDFSKLIFADQIDPRSGYTSGASTLAETPGNNNKYYFDAASGINVVAGKLMVGAAIFHMNKPDESLTGSPVTLPIRTTFHGSYRIPLTRWEDEDDASFLIPSVVAYRQSNSISYSAGMQFKHKGINAGLWYRSNQVGGEAVVASMIFDIFTGRYGDDKLRVGVSHDATASKLNYTNTSGTTEMSMGYEATFPSHSDNPRLQGRRCYDFY